MEWSHSSRTEGFAREIVVDEDLIYVQSFCLVSEREVM